MAELEKTGGAPVNEIIGSLYRRKSVRAYQDREIPQQEQRLIFQAAIEAPTAGNQQMYSILNITDQKLKDFLAESCDHQPFIAAAPLVLIFCADMQKWYDAFTEAGCEPRAPRAGDLILAIEDTMIAAQNAVVAAESLGIGSCYIGDILERAEDHIKVLNLPEYVVPVGMLVMGYPTEQQLGRAKPPRMRIEDIVMENGYVRKNGAQLREMFEAREHMDSFEQWMKAFCERKYNSDFSKEMSRSAEVYLNAFDFSGRK